MQNAEWATQFMDHRAYAVAVEGEILEVGIFLVPIFVPTRKPDRV